MRISSVKVMVVIFILLSFTGVYIGINTYKDNKETERLIKENYEQQIREVQEEQKRKEEVLRQQQEEERKIEEKRKAIEAKCVEAESLFSSKKYKEAIKKADEILIEDNSSYRALTIKGISLCYDRKTTGLEELNKALTIKPDYGYAMYNMALAYEISWQYDNALIWYEKALQAESEAGIKALSNYGLAVISARKSENDKAAEYLKRAVELDAEMAKSAAKEPLLSKIKLN